MTIKGEKMSKTSISYRNGLLKDLKDNGEAAAYLNAALEDGGCGGGGVNYPIPIIIERV